MRLDAASDALFFDRLPSFVCVLHLFKAFRRFNYLLLGLSQLKNEMKMLFCTLLHLANGFCSLMFLNLNENKP